MVSGRDDRTTASRETRQLPRGGNLGWDLPPRGVGFPAMLNFNPYNLLAGFIFGTLGWGAYRYGKRLERWQPMTIGVGLMVYPYLFENSWLLWGIGIGLLVTLWFHHDQ